MMMWNEFVEKVKQAKKDGKKLGFNANMITKLIFSGTFNSMLDPNGEYMKMPAHQRCGAMTAEILAAMGSKAQLPKASKTEAMGIDQIRNDAGLALWRHITNPLFQFNLSILFREHLRVNMGFQYTTTGNTKMIPMTLNLDGRPGCDLWARWEDIYTQYASYKLYQSGNRMAACIGVVTKIDKFVMKNGKTSLRVFFFDGFREYEIKLWPDYGKTMYNQAKAAYLKPCAVGLFVIKPDMYKGQLTGSLVHFYDISL